MRGRPFGPALSSKPGSPASRATHAIRAEHRRVPDAVARERQQRGSAATMMAAGAAAALLLGSPLDAAAISGGKVRAGRGACLGGPSVPAKSGSGLGVSQ